MLTARIRLGTRMKKTLFLALVFAAATAFAGIAKADGTASYSISGTYSSGTASTPLTQVGPNFTMNFSLPTQPASLIISSVPGDDFYLFPLTATYTNSNTSNTISMTTTLVNLMVGFYVANGSQNGGLFVDYCATDPSCNTGLEYQWIISGPPQYTGTETNPTIVPTSFQFSNQSFVVYQDFLTQLNSSNISGTVNGSAPVSAPETGSLGMLMLGFAGLALLVNFKKLAAVTERF
jgi:hypothetical protein